MTCAGCSKTLDPASQQRKYCSPGCAIRHNAKPRYGAANNNYNGGLSFNRTLGRWVIVCRDGSLMYYSRAVMAAHIGRLLARHELVHHKNEDPSDDRIENLEITTRADHARHHMPTLLAGRGL